MAVLLDANQVLDEIVAEVKKLDELEQRILLTKLRVKKLASQKIKPVANYDSTKIKPPTMAQIDKWKHDSRKQHAK